MYHLPTARKKKKTIVPYKNPEKGKEPFGYLPSGGDGEVERGKNPYSLLAPEKKGGLGSPHGCAGGREKKRVLWSAERFQRLMKKREGGGFQLAF